MKKFAYTILVLLGLAALGCNNGKSSQSNKAGGDDSVFTHIEIHPSPTKIGEIPLPEGYVRIKADSNSYAFFLRELPLKSSFADDEYHSDNYAVVDINLEDNTDLKSSDAIILLRSRYLYNQKQYKKIIYSGETKGELYPYLEYARGDYSVERFNE